jgi:hypothetical protein
VTRQLLIGSAVVLVAAGSMAACDDDGPDTETPGQDPVGTGVIFDPDVSEGVQTDTNQSGNMGFEPDDQAPGNVSPAEPVD